MPVCKERRSPVGASTTQGRELLHRIGEGNTLKQIALEGATVGIPVEPHEGEMPVVGIDNPLHKGDKVSEELGLVHNENLVSKDVLHPNVVKVAHGKTRDSLVVVRNDLGSTIACVVGVLDDKHGHTESGIPRENAEDP
jgi:hypothetical protein